MGDTTTYNVIFSDTLGLVNNEDGVSLFSNLELADNKIFFTHLDLYNKMDSLSVSNASINWQVSVQDLSHTRLSDNGPFELIFERDIFDLQTPYISLETESQYLSQETNITLSATYVYEGNMNINFDYSMDNGVSWINESSIDTLANTISINYQWNLIDEFGWGYFDNIHLRAYATAGMVSSDTLHIDNVTIANIVGDYVYYPDSEIGIKSNDIAELVSVFLHEGSNISDYDIGPSIGIAPELELSPDGIINFEDLATFTQMWHWSAENLTSITNARLSNGVRNYNNNFTIYPLIKRIEDEMNTIPFSIEHSNETDIIGLDLILKYDPQTLHIISISKGEVWNQNNSSIVLDKHISEKGIYSASAWSKNDNPLNLNGNFINLEIVPKNGFTNTNQIEVFLSLTTAKAKRVKYRNTI